MSVIFWLRRSRVVLAGVVTTLSLAFALGAAPAQAMVNGSGFLGPLTHIQTIASTVPGNGDVNPYGVAVVPKSVGRLHKGDVLVSNFNNSTNAQGTGTTIVQISPSGHRSAFANIGQSQVPGGVGLTTALVVLQSGWVIVGNLPTADGTSATAKAGALLVINSAGHLREIWTGHGINGPWDATAVDYGGSAVLFVTNVLNGTVAHSPNTVFGGTVLRLRVSLSGWKPQLTSTKIIGSGFPERTDPAALVVGPTGVALGHDGTLYVASTADSRIAAIPRALTRITSAGSGATVLTDGPLNAPLGLISVPGGHLVTVNGGNGDAVEFTPDGIVRHVRVLDTSGSPPGAGALFGLALTPNHQHIYFVDDATNELDLLR
jgi:hypothetical protein